MKRAGLNLFIALTPLCAQTLDNLPFGTAEFRRISTLEPNGALTFEPFQKLNWESKALAQIKHLNFDSPSSRQLEFLKAHREGLEFSAPLDPAIRRATYYVITMDGPVRLRPTGLKGFVGFTLNEALTKVVEKNADGDVTAVPAHPIHEAAFVITGTSDAFRPAEFRIEKSSGVIVYRLADGAKTLSWTAGSHDPTDLEKAASFRIGTRRFLIVKWQPIPSNCEFRYTLFSLGDGLKPIAHNDYNCDV